MSLLNCISALSDKTNIKLLSIGKLFLVFTQNSAAKFYLLLISVTRRIGPEIEDAMYNIQPCSQVESFKDKAELEMEPDDNAC
jgi:hypothetical protein